MSSNPAPPGYPPPGGWPEIDLHCEVDLMSRTAAVNLRLDVSVFDGSALAAYDDQRSAVMDKWRVVCCGGKLANRPTAGNLPAARPRHAIVRAFMAVQAFHVQPDRVAG